MGLARSLWEGRPFVNCAALNGATLNPPVVIELGPCPPVLGP
jgi:hypothetical protein